MTTATDPQAQHMIQQNYDLAIGELVVYGILILPLFSITRTAKFRAMGWNFLVAFTILQIVGAALTVSSGPHKAAGIAASIISNVGISPLMFATLGILGDAAIGTRLELSQKARKLAEVLFQVAVVAGTALFAVGFAEEYTVPVPSYASGLAKAGIIIILLDWLVLLVPVLISLARINEFHSTKPLVLASGFAIICIGVRVIYIVAEVFINSGSFLTSSFALRVCLSVIEGMLVVLAYVAAGLACRRAIANPPAAAMGQRIPRTAGDVEMNSQTQAQTQYQYQYSK